MKACCSLDLRLRLPSQSLSHGEGASLDRAYICAGGVRWRHVAAGAVLARALCARATPWEGQQPHPSS